MHLIQGLYFQRPHIISSENDFYHAGYAGTLFPDMESADGSLVGIMFDECGYSDLAKVVLTDEEFRYVKKYQQRDEHHSLLVSI